MRKLLIGLAILAILLTGLWYGAESWLGRMARDAVAGQPDISARIAPLRRPGRLGLHLSDVTLSEAGTQAASLPVLDAYLSLRSPATLSVDLPPSALLTPAGAAPMQLDIQDGQAEVTLSPLRGLAISHLGLHGRNLAMDGAPIFDSLNATARLTHMGGVAPDGSVAAYRVDLDAAGLAFGALPERLDIAGAVQVWLDRVPGPDAGAGGALPQPTGFQTPGVILTLDGMRLRLAGRVEADEQGLARGQAAIYTADGPAFVQAAVDAGLLSPDAALPLQGLIGRVAGAPPEMDAPAADPLSPEDTALADEIVTLPPAGPGEIRLPIFFGDGIMRLGPVPLGPAPRIAGF